MERKVYIVNDGTLYLVLDGVIYEIDDVRLQFDEVDAIPEDAIQIA